MKKISYFFVVCFFYATTNIISQITSKGNDFWLAFAPNHDDSQSELYLYISSDSLSSVNILIPSINWRNSYVLKPNVAEIIKLPSNAIENQANTISNKGIRITSDKPINCFAMNYKKFTTDGTLVLPISSLGNDYIALTTKNLSPAQILIVGTEKNTEIEILSTTNEKINLTLSEGHTYLVENSINDLTGTKIFSKNGKNFAVFVGNRCENIPAGITACDHLFEQLFPINTWGRHYIIPALYAYGNKPTSIKRTSTYKILASEDNTSIFLNNTFLKTINSRESFTVRNNIDFTLKSDKPILVAQFSEGSNNNDGVESDPFMILLSPVEQMRNDVVFVAPSNMIYIKNHFVNIVTSSNCKDNIYIDDQQIQKLTKLENDSFYVGVVEVSPGSHHLFAKNPDCGFNSYVYGSGWYDSYGYSAGVKLNKLSFKILGDTNCVGSPISFKTDFTAYDIIQYEWDFGDNSKSNESQPTHKYSRGGNYTVKLKVLYENGKIDSAAQTIKIIEIIARIKSNRISSDCSEDEYLFDDVSYINEGKIVKWLWDFGDGNTSNEKSPKHKYTQAGTFRVILTVYSDNGCFDKDFVIIESKGKLQVSAGEDQIICENEEISLNAKAEFGEPDYQFEWSPSQGLSDYKSQNPKVNINKSTTYVLSVKDAKGCIAYDTVNIEVKPIPKVNITQDFYICAGDSIKIGGEPFGADKPYSIEWFPKEYLSDPDSSITTAKPLKTTFYKMRITSANGCVSEYTVNVKINPVPNSDAGPDAIICFKDSVWIGNFASCGVEPFKYEWFPKNDLSDPFSAKTKAYPTKTTEYVLKVTDGINRIAYDTVLVIVNPAINVTRPENIQICSGEKPTLLISASGGSPPYNFFWYNYELDTIGLENQLTVSPDKSQTYYFRVTDSRNCEVFDSIYVKVNEVPKIKFATDTIITCVGQDVKLGALVSNGSPPYSYNWFPKDGLSSDTSNSTTAKPFKTTKYYLSITDANGCKSIDSIVVKTNPVPAADAGYDQIICKGDTIQLFAKAYCGPEPYSFEWQPNLYISNPMIANPFVYPNESTNFILKITDANGKSAYDTVSIIVNSKPSLIKIQDQKICFGDSLEITPQVKNGTPPFNFYWQPSNLISDTLATSIKISPRNTSTITLKVIDSNGCFDTDTFVVYTSDKLTISITGDTITCSGKPVQLKASVKDGFPPYQYIWQPSESLDKTDSGNPIASPDFNTTYKLFVIDSNGCVDSAFHKISVVSASSLTKAPIIVTSPKAKNLRIPIILEDEKDLLVCLPDSLRITMKWDATLFNPTGVSLGNFTKMLKQDTTWEVVFRIPNLSHIQKGKPLFEIIGDALLGKTDTTNLEIVDLSWFGINSAYDFISGKLIITDICYEGGERFLDYSNLMGILSVVPNPANDKFELKVQLSTNIKTEKIQILDALGRIAFEKVLLNDSYNDNIDYFQLIQKNLLIDAHSLQTGYYSIIYSLDSFNFFGKILIIR